MIVSATTETHMEIDVRFGPTERGVQQNSFTSLGTLEQGRQLAYDFCVTFQANGITNCVATLRLYRGPVVGHWSFLDSRPTIAWSASDTADFSYGAASSKLTAVENQGTYPGSYIPGQQFSDTQAIGNLNNDDFGGDLS